MANVRARNLGRQLGVPSARTLPGSESGAGYGPTLQRLASAAGGGGATSTVVVNGGGENYGITGSATKSATGNVSVLLDHTDPSYAPWTLLEPGTALVPPDYRILDLTVSVYVEFTSIPDTGYGSPNYQLVVPWGQDKAISNFYSGWSWLYNDAGAYASFAGTVVRAPGADIAQHWIGVTMEGISDNPLPEDPEGPGVSSIAEWTASASFTYFDRGSSLR